MAVAIEAYLALEASLTSRITGAWGRVAQDALPAIYAALERGKVADAQYLANNLDFSPVVRQTRDYLRYVSYASIMFGASRLNDVLNESLIIGEGMLTPIVNRATTSLALALVKTVGDQVRAKLLQTIREYQLEDKSSNFGVSEKAKKFDKSILRPYTQFYNPVNDLAQRMVQIISGLHTSRLAAYGYVMEAQLLGITKYAITEQLDTKICPVCRVMHGKVFEVEDAATLLDTVLLSDDPTELKTLQPWPGQSKAEVQAMREMSADELVGRGWHIPPYHPYCRGQLVKVGKVPKIRDTPSWQAAFPDAEPEHGDRTPEITPETFETFGVSVDEDAAKKWSAATGGVDPAEFLSRVTGRTPQQLADGIYDPVRDTYNSSLLGYLMVLNNKTEMDKQLEVLLQLKQGGMEDDSGVAVDMLLTYGYGQAANLMQLRNLTISDESKKNMPDLLLQWFAAAEIAEVTRVKLEANEDPDGKMWTQYGAIPEERDWLYVSEALTIAINEGLIVLSDEDKRRVLAAITPLPYSMWDVLALDITEVTQFIERQRMTLIIDMTDAQSMERFTEATA